MAETAPAPTVAIGYTQAQQWDQMWLEEETTPELQWPQSIAVYDQMRRTDSQCAAVLKAVTLPVRQTPWRIDPAGAKLEVAQFVADNLGLPVVGQKPNRPLREKDRFSFAEHLRLALLMLPLGHSYFEQIYRVDDAGERAYLRKLELRPSRTIERIDVATDGGLVAIKQHWTATNTDPKPIPVSRLVAYVLDREGGNWLGTSILRSAYKNWLLKDRLLRVQAQTIERNGMGIPVYEAAETERSLDAGLKMAQALRAGAAAGSATPFGAKLRLMGVEGTLPDATPVIQYHDDAIARAVLAHFLNLGTQTGSWALGTTFADFFALSLQTLAQQIADTATQHIVEDLVDINFGEQEPAPRLVFDEIGSRQAATAQAMKLLVDAGLITPDQVLDETLRQQFGLPPADPATATPPPAQAGPSERVDPEPVQGEGSVAASAEREGVRAKRRGRVGAKYDPTEPRDNKGRWTDGVPGPSVGGDKLKLGGRIQLGEGESLLSSRKFRSSDDSSDRNLLAAEVDTPGGRQIRLGIVDSGESKHWTAPSPEGRRRRLAELNDLLRDMSHDDDRFDDLQGERDTLMAADAGGQQTAVVSADGVAAMHSDLAAGVETAKAWKKDWDARSGPFNDKIDAIYGPHRDRPSQLTDAERAQVESLTEEMGEPDPYLMQGSVPVQGGAVLAYQILGDGEEDPATWRVQMAVRPADADEGWFIGSEGDAAVFSAKDVDGLLAGLAELAGSQGVRAKRPVHAHLHGLHDQKDHGRRLPKAGNLGSNPFGDFNRRQLRDAARRRRIDLEPRESRESIERKLAKHLAGDTAGPNDPIKLRDGEVTREELNNHSGYLPLGVVPEPGPRGSRIWTRRGPGIYLGPDNQPDVGGTTYWVELDDHSGGGGGMYPAGSIHTLNAAGDGPARNGGAWRNGRSEIPFPHKPSEPVEVSSTDTPTRMTRAEYTQLLRDENLRLALLRGTSEKDAKAQAGPDASIDELKERNTALRKALRRQGVDYRTEEQRRADDAEKNRLLDEVERLAVASGHDGPAKRAGASKMSRRELETFVADAREFQQRQKAKRGAERKGAAAVAAFNAAEANSRASKRQVGYIKGLLRERAKSGGKSLDGPTSTEDIEKLSNAEARAYINRLLRG